MFNPSNFRTLEGTFQGNLRSDRHLSLILVTCAGDAMWAKTVGDKEVLVAKWTDADLLLLAWTGQYSTDIFLLTRSDLEKFFRKDIVLRPKKT